MANALPMRSFRYATRCERGVIRAFDAQDVFARIGITALRVAKGEWAWAEPEDKSSKREYVGRQHMPPTESAE